MAYRTPESEKTDYFNIAKEVGKTAVLWPIQQYFYNPGMYSVSRGQIRAPFSGQGLQKFGRGLRRLPKGNQLVDWVKKTFDIDTSSNVMRSKEMWWGLTGDKSRFQFGLNAVVDKPSMAGSPHLPDANFNRSQLKAMRMYGSKTYDPKVLPKSVSDLFETKKTKLKKIKKRKIMKSVVMDKDELKILRMGKGSAIATGETLKLDRMAGASTFSIGNRANSLKTDWALPKSISRKLTPLSARTAHKAGSVIGTTLAYGKKIAPKVGRLGVKAGILGMKGFAYYQIGKLAWDAINFIMEPVGRGAIQAMDSAFRTYESVPQVEMGGQIAMSYLSFGAATERQKAISAISKAQINGRSNFGKESIYSHQ